MLELCCGVDDMAGVSVRDTGELDLSEWPGEALRDARRYPWEPRGGVPASDLTAERPFASTALLDWNATRFSIYAQDGYRKGQ